jgi:O-antigen ligase
MDDRVWPIILAAGILAAGLAGAWLISRWSQWSAAGPVALIVAAPLVPHLEVLSRLSTDDLLPLLGLGLLIATVPRPGFTRSTLLRAGLVAVAITTLARIATTFAHEPTVIDILLTLTAAVVRPIVLVATVVYVAVALRHAVRRRWAAGIVAALGTFEAFFSLAAFLIPLPGVGVRLRLPYEHLAGCDLRVTGTLGLSANHIGAVFVVTLPMTVGMAISASGRRRWLWAAAAALQATAVFLTFTRASILLGGAATVLLLLYYMRLRLAAVIGALCVAFVFGTTLLACGPQAPGITPTPTSTPTPGVPTALDRFTDPSDRAALWYAAGRMTLDYPLFGVGLGHMVDVMKQNPARYVDTPFGKASNSAHNTILLAGAETGLLGALSTLGINVVVALLALQALIFRRRSPEVVAAALAALAFLAQGMVNNLFTVPATGTLLAVLVGIIVAGRADDPPVIEPPP